MAGAARRQWQCQVAASLSSEPDQTNSVPGTCDAVHYCTADPCTVPVPLSTVGSAWHRSGLKPLEAPTQPGESSLPSTTALWHHRRPHGRRWRHQSLGESDVHPVAAAGSACGTRKADFTLSHWQLIITPGPPALRFKWHSWRALGRVTVSEPFVTHDVSAAGPLSIIRASG